MQGESALPRGEGGLFKAKKTFFGGIFVAQFFFGSFSVLITI